MQKLNCYCQGAATVSLDAKNAKWSNNPGIKSKNFEIKLTRINLTKYIYIIYNIITRKRSTKFVICKQSIK